MSDGQYVYKIVDENSNEYYYNQKLNGSGLIPPLIDTEKCLHNGKNSIMLKMAKYDYTLSDYLDKNPDENSLKQTLADIVKKSLELNQKYKIRQGDFHTQNIVYKHSDAHWAIIDLP